MATAPGKYATTRTTLTMSGKAINPTPMKIAIPNSAMLRFADFFDGSGFRFISPTTVRFYA
jgi:hypothetical protein